MDYLVFLWGIGRARVADDLTGADQKIPDRLVKTTFLGNVETAVRLVIKSWFADVGLSTGDSILGLLFLFNDSPLLIRLYA